MVSYWDLELIDVGLLAKIDQWMGVFRRENLQLQAGDMSQAEVSCKYSFQSILRELTLNFVQRARKPSII